MRAKTTLVLVPGLLCTRALWVPQIAALGDIAECMVADHSGHDTMSAIARSILEAAPARFALAGLSLGGFVCLEIVRQAPERVERLGLPDPNAGADTPERKAGRLELIELPSVRAPGRRRMR